MKSRTFIKWLIKFLHLLTMVAVGLVMLPWGEAAISVANEYQIKAVYLYKFTKGFIKWPQAAFANETTPFQLCVIGEDPFGEIIDMTVKNQKGAEERLVVVNRIDHLISFPICHILFVSKSEKSHLSQILDQVRGYPLLTVSDIEGFVDQGGIMELFTSENRIKFAINVCILRQVGLQADPNLLRMARLKKC